MKPTDVNVMIDLETLGLGPDAMVLSIGAVVFDMEKGLGDTFYLEISPETSPGKMDVGTVKFWMEQAKEGNMPPMNGIWFHDEAFYNFYAWLQAVCNYKLDDLIIWSNGTDFDIPKCKKAPWKYNNVRDCRTVFKLCGHLVDKTARTGYHNALADAKWQAEYLIQLLKVLDAQLVLPPLKEPEDDFPF